MPVDWKARFEAMVEDLRKNPLIDITEGPEFGAPPSDEEIGNARELCGGRLPDGVEELYQSMGSFRIKWRTKEAYPYGEDDGEPAKCGGFIRIPGILYVFESGESEAWFDFTDPTLPIAYLNRGDSGFGLYRKPFPKLKLFVDISEDACAALHPVPGDASIHYHYVGGDELWPTGLGVNEFLELLLESRGLLYWLAACTNDEKSREGGWFKQTAPLLFPGIDLSKFVPRTDEGKVEPP